jgi:hypothetical protein
LFDARHAFDDEARSGGLSSSMNVFDDDSPSRGSLDFLQRLRSRSRTDYPPNAKAPFAVEVVHVRISPSASDHR